MMLEKSTATTDSRLVRYSHAFFTHELVAVCVCVDVYSKNLAFGEFPQYIEFFLSFPQSIVYFCLQYPSIGLRPMYSLVRFFLGVFPYI